MPRKGDRNMGRFSVDCEIVNVDDLAAVRRGELNPDQVRRKPLRGVVDSGAVRLVLPQAVVKELGLPLKEKKIRVRYADGRRGIRSEVAYVQVGLQGRDGIFGAIVEPKRDSALIGAVVLEVLDFLVDCTNQRLVPRDPDMVVTEIE